MRTIVSLCVVTTVWAGAVCEADLAATRAIAQADQIGDERLSREQRNRARRSVLDAALKKSPDDIFLHSERQDLELGRYGENRPAVLALYEKRLAARPTALDRLYLAARAAFSYRTPRSIELLDKVLAREPAHGPALLLKARIRAARAFRDDESMKSDLLRFERACPATPGLIPEIGWTEDKEFLSAFAARQRPIVTARVNTLSLRAYGQLWQAERNAGRSDQRAGLEALWDADIGRLRAASVSRTASWFGALWDAEFLLDKRIEGIGEDSRATLPHAWPSLSALIREVRKLAAPEAKLRFRELGQRYPASTGLGSQWISFARSLGDDTALLEAFEFMKRAMELDPDSYQTSPPFQITMAHIMVTKKIGLDRAPQFAIAGLNAGARVTTNEVVSDLFPNDGQHRKGRDDRWRIDAYFAMLEAYAALKRESEARDILAQAQAMLDRMRPPSDSSPAVRGQFSWVEANYWRVRGLVEESADRRAEAAAAYRSALLAYPPRSGRADDRDAVASSLRRLLRELGRGTETLPTSWQDGNGGRNAWLRLAEMHPGTTITAMDGATYTPEQLSKRVSFVNVWATWCGPCREELPYLEQLAKRYSGKVVVIALNVDEEPGLVTPFLKSLRLEFSTSIAGTFAYDMLPVFSVPANYLLTPALTTYLEATAVGTKWLEQTGQLLDAALR